MNVVYETTELLITSDELVLVIAFFILLPEVDQQPPL